MEKLNESFSFTNDGKEIGLTVIDKIDYYSCHIDVSVDGNVLAENAVATISYTDKYPSKMFLRFESNQGRETMLCVCDLNNESELSTVEEVEKNRAVSDFLWRRIQDANFFAPSHPWSESHWRNMED